MMLISSAVDAVARQLEMADSGSSAGGRNGAVAAKRLSPPAHFIRPHVGTACCLSGAGAFVGAEDELKLAVSHCTGLPQMS
jgi:hypothetical protein